MAIEERVALVTGGCRGIGAAITRELTRAGTVVAAGCTSRVRARPFCDEMAAAGVSVFLVEGNVSEPEDCERTVNETMEEFGRLDILVNNAGITVDKTVKNMTVDDWRAVVRVNLSGSFFMSKAALPHLVGSTAGRIVNISSVIGQTGNFGQANYAASKSGLFGLTKTLALEYASKGVTVNCVAPGFVETEMVMAVPEQVREQIIKSIPVGRLGQPDEIARCVRFLADPANGYITGSVLAINGGLEM